MKCVVYKGIRKPDTYLYVESESDFSKVPPALLDALGRLEKVMNLELSPSRMLAAADPETVRYKLRDSGYYLQLPPLETGEFP